MKSRHLIKSRLGSVQSNRPRSGVLRLCGERFLVFGRREHRRHHDRDHGSQLTMTTRTRKKHLAGMRTYGKSSWWAHSNDDFLTQGQRPTTHFPRSFHSRSCSRYTCLKTSSEPCPFFFFCGLVGLLGWFRITKTSYPARALGWMPALEATKPRLFARPFLIVTGLSRLQGLSRLSISSSISPGHSKASTHATACTCACSMRMPPICVQHAGHACTNMPVLWRIGMLSFCSLF